MELGLPDTNGILRQPWVHPDRTSAGLGWDRLYVSTQHERPYRASFAPAGTHLLILHLSGPVTVSRGRTRLTSSRRIPAGGLFLHPAGRDLTVQLGGRLDTVHVYLADAALQEAGGAGDAGDGGRPVRLAEELGSADPLVEQLMLALDGLVRGWEPSARTYADHLTAALASHLVRRHSCAGAADGDTDGDAGGAGHGTSGVGGRHPGGLSERQFAAVRALMEHRLAEPLPLADLAAVTGLGVSQFARRFKAATGEAPHQFLLRLRVEQACRLLRTGATPIADVAVACGFSHQEHLTRVMRVRMDTTPAAIRRGG